MSKYLPSPLALAVMLLLCAAALWVAGVAVLAGTGWALLAAVPPVGAAGGVLLRGVLARVKGARNG